MPVTSERHVIHSKRVRELSGASPLLLMVATLAYATLLQWSYMTVEGVVGYTATDIKDVETSYLVASFVLIAMMAAVMPRRISRPSHTALWVLFLTWYVPSMLFTYHFGQLFEPDTFEFLLYVTAAFVVLIVMARGQPMRLPGIAISHETWALVLGIATVVVTAVVLTLVPQTHTGSFASMFNFDDVYTRRLQARQVIEGRSLMGYVLATFSASLAPLAMVYGLVTGRRGFVTLGTIAVLSVFMLDGTKGNFFVPLMLIVFVFLAERPHVSFGLACIGGLVVIICASIYLYASFDSIWLSANIVRRMIVGRAATVGAYFELFRDAPVYMRDSSLMALIGERAIDKSYLVGETYGGGLESNWNGNSWATMYADFGIAGLFIASALIATILRCYDGTTKHAPFPVAAAMAGYAAYVWGEAAVTSSILTYGVLATLVLLTHYGRVSPTIVSTSTPSRGRTNLVPPPLLEPLISSRATRSLPRTEQQT